MTRRLLAAVLALVILQPILLPAAAAADKPNPKRIAKIKAKVQKYADKQERVTVMLRDENRTEIKGVITAVTEDDFVLTPAKKGEPMRLAYDKVQAVNGPGMHWAAKVLIGVGIGLAALITGVVLGQRGS